MKRVTLAHGSGGKEGLELIKDIFYKYFSNEILLQQNDSSIIERIEGDLAVTTDSFVVNPIFFPGGNIGKLSICGTVNDLAVSGARPAYITAGFILEEGFEIEKLEIIVKSMADTAKEAGVKIVAGDTKVVEKGNVQGIYINTTGIGYFHGNRYAFNKDTLKVGDKIIINGHIGDHGMCIMGEREYLGISSEIESDCAPLNNIIDNIISISDKVRIMRDPTRGGIATTLNELVEGTKKSMVIRQDVLPIKDSVKNYCDLLGIDPLYVANEGKFICIVAEEDADEVLKVIKNNPKGREAVIIGEIIEDKREKVYLKTSFGTTRILRMAEGEILPRIC